MEKRVQVAVSSNPKKVSERLDINGNVIDPVTKQIISKVEWAAYIS